MRRKHGRRIILSVAIAALALGALAAFGLLRPAAHRAPEQKFEATDVTGAAWGRTLELTDHHGVRRTLADFRGKVVLLFFGYTNCPDMCPTTMAKLGEAVRQLGIDAPRVQGLFVTVDPKRDTPRILAQFVPAFHPSFLGLYGSEDETRRAAGEFKVFFQAQKPGSAGFYTVDHSGQTFVFDREGRLRLFVKPEATVESIVRDLRALLAETSR